MRREKIEELVPLVSVFVVSGSLVYATQKRLRYSCKVVEDVLTNIAGCIRWTVREASLSYIVQEEERPATLPIISCII